MLVMKILFFIGLIAILMLIGILYCFGESDDGEENVLINILFCISVIFTEGIIAGNLYYHFYMSESSTLAKIACTFIPMLIMYVVHMVILGNVGIESSKHVIYFILFIVSTFVFFGYINNYNKNVEILNETEVVDSTDLQLIAINNYIIPNVSGDISGKSIIGSGTVNGSISTSAENVISFWYEDENNEGTFQQVDASSSKIKFINDNEKAHVEVISYITKEVKKDHNNNKEEVLNEKEYKEYKFYIPESLRDYTLK